MKSITLHNTIQLISALGAITLARHAPTIAGILAGITFGIAIVYTTDGGALTPHHKAGDERVTHQ